MITIIGPTASGKTPFAVELAHNIDGEIISGDSRQVYRYMDIGTGKDLKEYIVRDKKIKTRWVIQNLKEDKVVCFVLFFVLIRSNSIIFVE